MRVNLRVSTATRGGMRHFLQSTKEGESSMSLKFEVRDEGIVWKCGNPGIEVSCHKNPTKPSSIDNIIVKALEPCADVYGATTRVGRWEIADSQVQGGREGLERQP